jgi:IPT/TIG domain
MAAISAAIAAAGLLVPVSASAASTKPTISKLSKTSVSTAGGTRLTITGTHFSHVTSVKFGAVRGKSVTVVSSKKIQVTVPAHAAGALYVHVTTSAGTTANRSSDHITFVAPPAVSKVSPASGTANGGTRITITGSHFSHLTSVKFGSVAGRSLKVLSSTKLQVTAPKHAAGLVDIRVAASVGTSTIRTADRYAFLTKPVITSLTAQGSAAGGTRVTINGSSFTASTKVSFGSVAGTAVAVASTTRLTVTAPAHAIGTVSVSVVTSYGTSAAKPFSFVMPPVAAVHASSDIGATAGSAKVTLSWTNPNFAGYTGVMIRRTAGGIAPATATDGTLVKDVASPATTFTDTGLTQHTEYTYALFAHDAGAVHQSARVAVTLTTLDRIPPGAVTALSATPGHTGTTPTVLLAWTPPSDADFAGVAVCRADGSKAPTASACAAAPLKKVPAGTSTFTDATGLSSQTQYAYTVLAYDTSTNFSTAASITATTPDVVPPGPVTALTVVARSNSAVLTWTDPTAADLTGITVRRALGTVPPASPTDGTDVPASGTTVTDFGLTPSTKYAYAVFTHDAALNYSTAVTKAITTLAPDVTAPGPVTGLVTTPGSSTVSLSWVNPSAADFTGVTIRRSQGSVAPTLTGGPVNTVTVLTTTGSQASFTDSGLTPATTYTYAVFARDDVPNYSTAATRSVTTTAANGPGPIMQPSASNVTADALPTVQIDGVAWSQAIVGNTVYVGGSFANARPAGAAAGTSLTPRANMLAYNLQTGVLISSFAPSFNGVVKTVAVSPDGSRLYVGGDFTKVNNVTHNRIVAISTATGLVVPAFTASLDAGVRAIVATNTTVYAGGLFGSANGSGRARLAAFQASNGALTTWSASADYTVNALVLTPDGSKLVVGGAMTVLDGVTVLGIGAVSAATGSSVNWVTSKTVNAYGTGAAIESLSTDGTAIYGSAYNFHGTGNIEGAFSTNQNDGGINWVEDCHGDTYDTFPVNGIVYTVSHAHYCANDGGWTNLTPETWRHSVAFTAQVTGTLLKDSINDTEGYPSHTGVPSPSIINWFPDFTTGTYTGQSQAAWTVTGNSQYVVEGGEFPTVNNTGQQGLVRFAVRPIAPGKQGPRVTGVHFVPTLSQVGATSVKVSFGSNWDRDDKTLTYKIVRDSDTTHPVATFTADSEWWNLPPLTFVDTTAAKGTHTYRLYVTDAEGNVVAGDTATITVT